MGNPSLEKSGRLYAWRWTCLRRKTHECWREAQPLSGGHQVWLFFGVCKDFCSGWCQSIIFTVDKPWNTLAYPSGTGFWITTSLLSCLFTIFLGVCIQISSTNTSTYNPLQRRKLVRSEHGFWRCFQCVWNLPPGCYFFDLTLSTLMLILLSQ